jgi:1,4-alpha-glucan branching enzyme
MLLFMGGEFGQSSEWQANSQLEWWLLEAGPYHRGVQRMVKELNHLYLAEPALWEADFAVEGFQWIDCQDSDNSVLSFLRRDSQQASQLAVILNLTPVPRMRYRMGLPRPGKWVEAFNSDAAAYGGGNLGNFGAVMAEEVASQHQPCSAVLTLPPLSILILKAPPTPPKEVTPAEDALPSEQQSNPEETTPEDTAT